jgi:hypothetical protein
MNRNSELVRGSIFMYSVESIRKLSASMLFQIEDLLELSYRYSVIGINAARIWSSLSDSIKRVLSGADFTRSMIGSGAAVLYRIKEWACRVACNIYSGSFFLDAIGRAAENSRWLK